MKIRKIKFENNEFFGSIELDFTNNGKTVDTIIIAGENGCGKSQLLDILYSTSSFIIDRNERNEKRFFEIEISEEEVAILSQQLSTNSYIPVVQPIKDRIIYILIDYNITNSWEQIQVIYNNDDGEKITFAAHIFSQPEYKKITDVVFSEVAINYTPQNINHVTSKEIDTYTGRRENLRSSTNLATDIAQLFIDIQVQDALDLSTWVKNNVGQIPDQAIINVRMNRFTNAYNQMFPFKRYKSVETINNSKQIIFEEFVLNY